MLHVLQRVRGKSQHDAISNDSCRCIRITNICGTLYFYHSEGQCNLVSLHIMALMRLVAWYVALLKVAQGVIITGESLKNITVEHGNVLTLWCNYSFSGRETGSTSIQEKLALNGSDVFTYFRYGANVVDNGTFKNYFGSKTDITSSTSSEINSKYIRIRIQRAQWEDSGNYNWNINVDGEIATAANDFIHVLVGEKPSKPTLSSTKLGSITYSIMCIPSNGIPLPSVTIYNSTGVALTSSGPSASITVNVTTPTKFYCTGANDLGSQNSSFISLPEPTTTTTTMTTETATTLPAVTSPAGGSLLPVSTMTSSSTTTRDSTEKTGEQPPLGLEKIVGIVVGGVAFVLAVIIIGTCIHKHSANKRQANPDKENAVAEPAENQYSETQMNDIKYQQEQEENQKKNVEGLQYADLDLRPTGKTKPAGGGGRNNLVIDEDSRTEYAEVRKA